MERREFVVSQIVVQGSKAKLNESEVIHLKFTVFRYLDLEMFERAIDASV